MQEAQLLNGKIPKKLGSKVEIFGADLSDANLDDAWLDFAWLSNVHLRGANLAHASLLETDLRWRRQGKAPAVGLEPTTLRVTAGCSAN